ncbi:hypothetical protein O9992_29675 [Vibrio lentus]|nr:hypothetical protein [Vibrio lentus]
MWTNNASLTRLSVRRLDSRPVSVLVPYNINELPKPNDGYGYDDDGTITGVSEDIATMSSTNDAYYQDYNNSYAALDGWGFVCRADFNSSTKC